MRKSIKHLVILLTLIMCINLAYAAGITVEIDTKTDDVPVEGITWNITKVADKDVYGSYHLLADFAECAAPAEGMSAAELATLAGSYYNVIVAKGITPVTGAVSNSSGIAVIEGLEKGVYVFACEEYVKDYKKYTPVPAIIEITGQETGAVRVEAKFQVQELQRPTRYQYRVEKVWSGEDNNTKYRPSKVVIEIFCDGNSVEEVTLDASNNWNYEWESESDHNWSVIEKDVSEYYKVVYKEQDGKFVVENTFASNITPTPTPVNPTGTPTPTTTPKLPQTGQLNWPVPMLLLAGMILIGIGITILSKSKKDL